MARIYKENNWVVIEGYGSIPTRKARYDFNEPIVSIYDDTKNKVPFSARWQKIEREDGSVFATPNELTTYLDETLTQVETDFLAYYILNRDS